MPKRTIASFIFLVLVILFALVEYYYEQQETLHTVDEISLCFTQQQNCTFMYEQVAHSHDPTIFCALYDFEQGVFSEEVTKTLLSEHSVIDKKNYVVLQDEIPRNIFLAQPAGFSGLMHHKTCIYDSTIVTGSANPTINGFYHNDNIVFTFTNATFASDYEQEIKDMLSGERHDAKMYSFTSYQANGTFILCNKNCRDILYQHINNAQISIHFATFTFTDQVIATAIKERHYHNVSVHGVIEKKSSSKKIFEYLAGLNVTGDANPKTMHHKFFVLDNKTVIVGSYNPTLSANQRNAEIMIILESQEIAHQFIEEWQRVYQLTFP